MNESFPAELNQPGPKVHGNTDGAATASRSAPGLVWLAVLLALVSLAGTGWLWWQSQGRENAAADLAAEADRQSGIVSGLEGQVSSLESRIAGMASEDPSSRLNGFEQDLKSLQAQADSARSFQDQTNAWTRTMQAVIEGDQSRLAAAEERLDAVSARNMTATEELDLAEVDYLLRMAQERLVLFGDSRTAAQALRLAGEEMQAFDNPLYLGLSSDIAQAQQKTAAVITPDFPALHARLDGLQGLVDRLPLKGADAPAAPATEEPAGWWARVRGAFSGLVTVRRTTALEDELPLLADQALVRQQAWLELDVARLAAMRRDGDSWKAALDRFASVLNRWFDPSAPSFADAVSQLDALKAIDIDPELPDISAPLKTLQAMRAAGVADQGASANPGLPREQPAGLVEPEPAEVEAVEAEAAEAEAPGEAQ